jgi:hypothetical protein
MHWLGLPDASTAAKKVVAYCDAGLETMAEQPEKHQNDPATTAGEDDDRPEELAQDDDGLEKLAQTEDEGDYVTIADNGSTLPPLLTAALKDLKVIRVTLQIRPGAFVAPVHSVRNRRSIAMARRLMRSSVEAIAPQAARMTSWMLGSAAAKQPSCLRASTLQSRS